jgi:hypothetical protein
VRAFARGLAFVTMAGLAACGDSKAPPPPTAPTATSTVIVVAIEGPFTRDLDFLGDTLQLRAFATRSDGSRSDVTADATWSVSNTAVVSVTARGLVTGVGYGAGAVRAVYRERWSEVGINVFSRLRADYRVSGVVRDAMTGAPIAGARVWRGGLDPGIFTDGNGAFTHTGGVVSGRTLMVSMFGYDFGRIDIPGIDPPTQLDVRLIPDREPFIERTVVGTFDPIAGNRGPTSAHRSVTRPGGLVDAEVVQPDCRWNSTLSIEARSGGVWFGARDMPSGCYSRLRFVAPDSEVVLTLHGSPVPVYELRFREAR